MMRLIFLFYAEETDLLPMSEPLYVERYATSSLRDRLQAVADEYGEEVLESTYDGWPRLLSAWRAVFGGVEHGDMVLSPYGGSFFDPDRYPLLEGRQPESSWVEAADPLPIDNRTVLHLLNALQTLDEGGPPTEAVLPCTRRGADRSRLRGHARSHGCTCRGLGARPLGSRC